MDLDRLEADRLNIQESLDTSRSTAERNRLGQFATPTILAREIIQSGLGFLEEGKSIRFLDPALGTGSFFSALLNEAPSGLVSEAIGIELDSYYGKPAEDLWEKEILRVVHGDFTSMTPPDPKDRPNFLICNPPYVRHHHLAKDEKKRLGCLVRETAGIELNGLAGLYCYFLGLAHQWMAPNGIAGWLIPSEFMDVNYGSAIRDYLRTKVTLLGIHRFDPAEVQFDDALVSSAIVWLKNCRPQPNLGVKFTFGGSLGKPSVSKVVSSETLRNERKWSRFPCNGERVNKPAVTLGDLFHIKRGIATGNNKVFMLQEEEVLAKKIPSKFLRPILPSPRYLKTNEVLAKSGGNPDLENNLYLVNCTIEETEVKNSFPELYEYLESGKEKVANGYLCRKRPTWYFQEQRTAPPLLCTYMGRFRKKTDRPFRFILNHSNATATNVYLMLYPRSELEAHFSEDPGLINKIWQALNEIDQEDLIGEGRVYGGGLHKLEPKELQQVDLTSLVPDLPPPWHANLPLRQMRFAHS